MPAAEQERIVQKNKNVSSTSGASVFTTTSSQADPYAEEAIELEWDKQLTLDHQRMLDKANIYKKGFAQQHYDYLASNYEGIYERLYYPDPVKVAEMAALQFVQDPKIKKRGPGIDISTLRILDLGCGTGLVGKALYEKGFRNIVGLDISQNMMEKAAEKSVYSELHEVDVSEAQFFPDKFFNQFDIVVCSGLINCHHMDYNLFEIMTLALKKDGLAIFTGSYSSWGTFWYTEVIKAMVKEQRWNLVSEEVYANYGGISPAPGRFYKSQGKAFCFKNI